MKTSSLAPTYVLFFSLLAGCGGGGSTPTPQKPQNIISVAFSPASAPTLDANQSDSFTANVSNDSSNQGVTWTLICPADVSACGTLAQIKTLSGAANNYAAPASLSAAATVTIIATSISDSTKSKSLAVTVNPVFALVNPLPAQPQPGAVGQPFSLNLMTFLQGGTLPFTWVIKFGTLPPGLTLNVNTGMVTGTPTAAGTTAVAFNSSDSGNPPTTLPADLQISLNINAAGGLIITSGPPPNGSVGVAYGGSHVTSHGINFTGFPLTATGGAGSFAWSWAAAPGSFLPPGLNVNVLFFGGSTRCCTLVPVISGTPTAGGTYQVFVTATDSGSPAARASASYTITIVGTPGTFAIATAVPSPAVLNIPYTFTFTASGGIPPFTWTDTGTLSTGLMFSSTGVLSGTPTVSGSFPVSIMAQDSRGQNTAPENFTIQVVLHGFKATGSMAMARYTHTATLLNDGKVLVTGGTGASGESITAAELFNLTNGTFTSAGSIGTARSFQTATLLNNGKVLVTGGGTAIAELFDPASGSFAPTGSMDTTRSFQTATLLNDGKVLVTGGSDAEGNPLANAELFDPSSGSFAPTSSMAMARFGHTATLLNDGKVLVTGGTGSGGGSIATAELFNPTSGTFSSTGSMGTARYAHTATLLANGRVLVAGGFGTSFTALATAELFDPAAGMFTSTGSMETEHAFHTAILLNDGTVVVIGGEDANRNIVSSAQVFDSLTGTFASTGSMGSTRSSHTVTLLNNGTVLVTGGIDGSGLALSTAELYE